MKEKQEGEVETVLTWKDHTDFQRLGIKLVVWCQVYFDTAFSERVHLKKDFQSSRQKVINCLKIAINAELRGRILPKQTLLNKCFPVEKIREVCLDLIKEELYNYNIEWNTLKVAQKS